LSVEVSEVRVLEVRVLDVRDSEQAPVWGSTPDLAQARIQRRILDWAKVQGDRSMIAAMETVVSGIRVSDLTYAVTRRVV
jgi:hypothetical protein